MARKRVSRKELRQQRKAAWALFERSDLRRVVVLVVGLKIAAILLVFDTKGLDAFDLPKTVVSHAFAWLLAGLLVTAVLRHGHEIVPRTRLHAFVAAFLLAAVISAAFAENTYVALFGERDRYQGLTFLADMAVLYLAVAVAFRTVRDWVTLLALAGAACAISLAYAFIQVAGVDPNKWELDTQGRPFGTFGHPDTFGHLLAIAFGVAAAVAVFAPARERGLRVAAAAGAVASLVGMGVVATRGSALGVAAAIVAVPTLAVLARGVPRTVRVTALAVTGAAVVAAVALVFASPLGSRLRATATGYATQDRVVIYENAWNAFRDRPIAGWGPDGFAVAYPHYQQPREDQLHGINTLSTSAHDWALNVAATLGGLGLATYLALLAAAVVLVWRAGLERWPSVAAPLLVGGAAYWASGLVTPNSLGLDWYAWLFFGAAAAIAGTRLAEQAERDRGGALWTPAVVAVAVGLFLAYQTALADREALTAQLYVTAKDPAAATARAQAAIAADSGRARYWSILGAADQAAHKWRDAIAAHGESAKRAPYVANYWVNVARSYAGAAASGDSVSASVTAAMEAARKGIATSPYEPVPHAVLAQIANDFTDDRRLAQTEMTRAIALYQSDPSFDPIAAAVAAKEPDARAALAFVDGLLRWKDSAQLRVAAAQAALRAGDRDVARDNARKALELDPANADARGVLATLGG